jgi:capsular exopolysaccharide synthesis family protein
MTDPDGLVRVPWELPPDGNGTRRLQSQTGGGLAVAEPLRGYGVPADEEAHFWDYWGVLTQRRWTVISCFVTTVIVATIWTFTVRPVFTGTATLRIEKEQPRVVKFEEVMKEADSQQDYYQTQYKILQSRALANRVIGLLRLDQHPEFQRPDAATNWLGQAEGWLRETLIRWLPLPPPRTPEATEDLSLESPLTNVFLHRLSVEPIRNSRLVKISFDSYFPDVAARVANTLADAFIAQQLDQKVEATRYATQFLAKQLEEARGKLAETEDQLNRFLKANDILFIASDRTGQPQDLISQQLTLLSDALLKVRAERIARESVTAQASSHDIASLPAVLQNAVIGKLKEDLATAEGEYEKLGQTFKPDYPRMEQLARRIAEGRRQLVAEINRTVQALQAEYDTAVRNEGQLEAALTQQQVLARRLSTNMAQYNLLRREVDTSRELYSSLLGRLRETQVSAALFTSNISVVDRAEIPSTPSRPRKSMNLLLACLIGLFGGVGLALAFEYLDTNIKDTKEVETVLRVPMLGLVPSWSALHGRRRRRQLHNGNGDAGPFALVAHADMASVFAEAFRNLRTNLLYSAPERPPKTIMVTSLQPGDGKTSLVTNLAITLSQLGAGEVLVIDADMRRPNVHEILDVEQAPGLSTFLTGQAELSEVIALTRIGNLFVIPSGRVPLNPAELLASKRLREAITTLSERFTYIVFDTGPLFGVSDAAILAGQVEGVMLVLRHGRASREAAQRAIRNLISVRAKLLGVILNDVDVRGNGYYGYGYYGYYAHNGHDDVKNPVR